MYLRIYPHSPDFHVPFKFPVQILYIIIYYQCLKCSFCSLDAKRLIGRKFDDPEVQQDMKHWPFTVANEGGRPKIKVEYKGDTKLFFAEEVSCKGMSTILLMKDFFRVFNF